MKTAAYSTCPKCNGSARETYLGKYANIVAGYRHEDGTIACCNCGGQTMSTKATGYTRVDPATGAGCLHTYKGVQAGRCYNVYTCTKCGDRYDIDSGD